MSTKLVIFDLDGTLIDAYRAVTSSVNFMLKELGRPTVSRETVRRGIGWGDARLIETYAGTENLARATRIYRRHHREALKTETKLLPGAKGILDFLKKGKYRLAVATNRPTPQSHIVLRHLSIRDYFHYVLCGDRLPEPKPHPEILVRILKRFSMKPAEALYVGDMTVDVMTGKGARVRTVAVITGSSPLAEVRRLKPFKIIRRLSELRPILEK